jgi:hypothetical protein
VLTRVSGGPEWCSRGDVIFSVFEADRQFSRASREATWIAWDQFVKARMSTRGAFVESAAVMSI